MKGVPCFVQPPKDPLRNSAPRLKKAKVNNIRAAKFNNDETQNHQVTNVRNKKTQLVMAEMNSSNGVTSKKGKPVSALLSGIIATVVAFGGAQSADAHHIANSMMMMPPTAATESIKMLCDTKNPDMVEMRKGTLLSDESCTMFRRG